MPDFGMWDAKVGDWVVENHGVDPDIEVENVPADMVAGKDAQLERAIQWCLDELRKSPPVQPNTSKDHRPIQAKKICGNKFFFKIHLP